jgi:hypothetical protein
MMKRVVKLADALDINGKLGRELAKGLIDRGKAVFYVELNDRSAKHLRGLPKPPQEYELLEVSE